MNFNSPSKFGYVAVPNAALGSALALSFSRDFSGLSLQPTVAGLASTLAALTALDVGRILLVQNLGAVTTTLNTVSLAPQTVTIFAWTGTTWQVILAKPTVNSIGFLSRSSIIGASTNLIIPWNAADIQGTEIAFVTPNRWAVSPPAGGRRYRMTFNLSSIAGVLAGSVDVRFRNASTNTLVGNGTSLFMVNGLNVEGASGVMDYVTPLLTTTTQYEVVVVAQINTPSIGNATNSRFPTMVIVAL